MAATGERPRRPRRRRRRGRAARVRQAAAAAGPLDGQDRRRDRHARGLQPTEAEEAIRAAGGKPARLGLEEDRLPRRRRGGRLEAGQGAGARRPGPRRGRLPRLLAGEDAEGLALDRARVALHQVADAAARAAAHSGWSPKIVAGGAPAPDLGHRGDDRVVGELRDCGRRRPGRDEVAADDRRTGRTSARSGSGRPRAATRANRRRRRGAGRARPGGRTRSTRRPGGRGSAGGRRRRRSCSRPGSTAARRPPGAARRTAARSAGRTVPRLLAAGVPHCRQAVAIINVQIRARCRLASGPRRRSHGRRLRGGSPRTPESYRPAGRRSTLGRPIPPRRAITAARARSIRCGVSGRSASGPQEPLERQEQQLQLGPRQR